MSSEIQEAQQLLNTLRSPAHALPAFGEVHDQKTARFTKYSPYAITDKLQPTILDYMSNQSSSGRRRSQRGRVGGSLSILCKVGRCVSSPQKRERLVLVSLLTPFMLLSAICGQISQARCSSSTRP